MSNETKIPESLKRTNENKHKSYGKKIQSRS